ncbi:MAG TPA: prolipoprotein diacylglyceryl transferase family protein, partial [Bacteroidia bacterium]|nr:prolipoprotein diacylglyceryl transferase family protein [Bacteroidia bacterium]
MYPTIYDAVKDLFGKSIPFLKLLQSFGFFVAIAFLLCAWAFAKELNRKEKLGLFRNFVPQVRKYMKGLRMTSNEIVSNFAFSFVIGYKFTDLIIATADANADPRAYMLSLKGNLIGGIVVALAWTVGRYYYLERKKLPQPIEIEEKEKAGDHVGNMTLLAAAFGFLGAKIFHILENFGEFRADPKGMFFSFSGLTMYGGLIVGGAAVLIYSRKKKLDLLHVMDACAPGLLLAYGVGRLGCHISGDGDWGVVNNAPKPHWMGFLPNWTWAYDYPNNVNHQINPYTDTASIEYKTAPLQALIHGNDSTLVAPVFPTPFYEAMIMIALFFVFWFYVRKKVSSPGMLFSIYLVANGVERFFIELIRVDTTLFHISSFRVVQAQFIATILVLLGVTGIWWTKKNAKKNPP